MRWIKEHLERIRFYLAEKFDIFSPGNGFTCDLWDSLDGIEA